MSTIVLKLKLYLPDWQLWRYSMLAMNTVTTWQTQSRKLEDTLRLGEAVGRQLKGGELIELTSDLGGGKTSFVRGLAKGMGITDTVASPSFTINRQYKVGDLSLNHYDFYRLNDPGIMTNELNESLNDPKAVIAIEWAEAVADVLPTDRLEVAIKTTGETARAFTFSAGRQHEHLLKELA